MRRLLLTCLAALAMPLGLAAPAAAAPGDDVVVTDADNGRTVTLALGQKLRVELTPPSGEIWSDVDAGNALHRHRIDVDAAATKASFTALSPTAGETVSATTDSACFHSQPACLRPSRQWSVNVVVQDQPNPGPSPSPQPCISAPVPSVGPGTVLAEESSDGRTLQVPRGDQLLVVFPGCRDKPDFQPAEGGGPLYRESAHANNPGGATSSFRAMSLGSTTVTAVRDAPCLHERDGCAITAQVWQITVEVVEPRTCDLTGPAKAAVGSAVPLSGRAQSGATVRVWFKPYGAAGYVVRRVLTAAADGTFATSYTAWTDQRWFATADGGCTTAAGLTQVAASISGPVTATRGQTVELRATGVAGQPVAIYARRSGGEFTLIRTGRLDGAGAYRTSYVAAVDLRYYAKTGPEGRTSTWGLTQVR